MDQGSILTGRANNFAMREYIRAIGRMSNQKVPSFPLAPGNYFANTSAIGVIFTRA
jgi:hypothetical protein